VRPSHFKRLLTRIASASEWIGELKRSCFDFSLPFVEVLRVIR
jgi:hypothetical protein